MHSGKLYTNRLEPGILFISLPIVSLFKLAIMHNFRLFVVSESKATSFKKVQRRHDMIKARREIDNIYQATCNIAVNM